MSGRGEDAAGAAGGRVGSLAAGDRVGSLAPDPEGNLAPDREGNLAPDREGRLAPGREGSLAPGRERNLARSAAHRAALHALAGILSRGLVDEDVAWLAGIPGLGAVEELSEDDRLAEHERVLGRGVFAYRSVFTHADGLRVEAPSPWFEHHDLTADEPDALGSELALYAHTADPELGRELTWAVPALIAIERQGGAIYPTVARMARALLADAGLDGDAPQADTGDPLDDPHTGLRRLAEHLLLPARSGCFLSRDDLLRLSASAEMPCGFGSRRQMLETYLRSAVEHGRLPTAVAVLDAELEVWETELRPLAPGWSARVSATRAVLSRLSEASAASS